MFDCSPLDKKILTLLQNDAKASMQAIADGVHSSAAQCWRRVKRLHDGGVITGYHARLDPEALGLNAAAYVHVALLDHSKKSIESFLSLVDSEDQIVECASITGDHDFLLKVYAETPAKLESFLLERLLNSGLVRHTSSQFVLRHRKIGGVLPISAS